MSSITVITCFTYPNNEKFVFNPDYLRSDLRRILAFSHNQIGSSLKDIYVLTDIVPDEKICNEIIRDFQEEVTKSLKSRKVCLDTQLLNRSQIYRKRPLEWLEYLLKILAISHVFEPLIQEILPIIRRESSVEFASLFTNFALIFGKQEYEECLAEIFQRSMKHLFFYYSGHGVRLIDLHEHELSLAIPTQTMHPQYYSRKALQKCFQKYLHSIDTIVVFDCCYGEKFLEQPYQIGFLSNDCFRRNTSHIQAESMIYLSGTRSYQTCGFYKDPKEFSSLYTYYFLKYLNKISTEIRLGKDSRELCRLHVEVENRVQEYRRHTGKEPQNMLIGLSNSNINRLPKWLFKNAFAGKKNLLFDQV